MSVIDWRKEGTSAIISMNNGENRQNPDFMNGMHASLDGILKDESIKSVIITSSDKKNWSQGIDVDWMINRINNKDTNSIKEFMYGMNEFFKRILLFPMPVIAAINGHAFGNGAMLACVCDFRFMKSDRGFFCFPEVDLGIPFLPGMVAFVRKAVPDYMLYDMKFTGRRLGAPELEKNHIIMKACENEEALNKTVMEFAGTFNKRRGIFAEMKRRTHKGIIDIIDNDDREMIEKLNIFIQD
jgi:Delta3-Delta2-enoyl-CoA isomerase